MFDKISAVPGHEKRPASAQTENGANPNTLEEVGLMPRILPLPTESEQGRTDIALQYLRMTRVQLEQAKHNRDLYVKLGRAYGLTNQAIGEALGITEARVRHIVAGLK